MSKALPNLQLVYKIEIKKKKKRKSNKRKELLTIGNISGKKVTPLGECTQAVFPLVNYNVFLPMMTTSSSTPETNRVRMCKKVQNAPGHLDIFRTCQGSVVVPQPSWTYRVLPGCRVRLPQLPVAGHILSVAH